MPSKKQLKSKTIKYKWNAKESGLVQHAEKELRLAGLFDKDSDYNGMLGKAALEMVTVFAKQGHSGCSAGITTSIVEKLMRYQILTPLKNPLVTGEFNEVGGYYKKGKTGILQSTRISSVFSNNGGKTWYDIDKQNKTWTWVYWRVFDIFKIKSDWLWSKAFKSPKFANE